MSRGQGCAEHPTMCETATENYMSQISIAPRLRNLSTEIPHLPLTLPGGFWKVLSPLMWLFSVMSHTYLELIVKLNFQTHLRGNISKTSPNLNPWTIALSPHLCIESLFFNLYLLGPTHSQIVPLDLVKGFPSGQCTRFF